MQTMFGNLVDHAPDQLRRHAGRVHALESPVRHREEDDPEAGRVAEILRVIEDLGFARGVEIVGIAEQHELAALRLSHLHRFDVLFERVEHRVVDEREPALGFVVRPADELAILLDRDRHFRYEQRAPEAVLDLLADVVAYAFFVEALQIGACTTG